MRATITIKPSKGNTFALARYCVEPKAENAKAVGLEQATEERLKMSFGINCNVDDPADLANDLEKRPQQLLSRKGKMHRHVVFSLVGELIPAMGVQALKKLGKDWHKEFCPDSKAGFFIHGDGSKLHMHAIVESYDPRIYKRHDWDQRKDGVLSKMQDMEYTSAVSPGKGNKLNDIERSRYSGKQSDRSLKIDTLKAERKTKDSDLAKELVSFVKMVKSKPKSESGLLSLLQQELPEGWTLKYKTRKGKPLAKPSISNGKTTVRLARFWKWLESKPKAKEKKQSKTGIKI